MAVVYIAGDRDRGNSSPCRALPHILSGSGAAVGTYYFTPIRCQSMSKPQLILGTYKITHMDQWDQDFVDASGFTAAKMLEVA